MDNKRFEKGSLSSSSGALEAPNQEVNPWPADILLNICEKLQDPIEVARLKSVCSSFNKIITDKELPLFKETLEKDLSGSQLYSILERTGSLPPRHWAVVVDLCLDDFAKAPHDFSCSDTIARFVPSATSEQRSKILKHATVAEMPEGLHRSMLLAALVPRVTSEERAGIRRREAERRIAANEYPRDFERSCNKLRAALAEYDAREQQGSSQASAPILQPAQEAERNTRIARGGR